MRLIRQVISLLLAFSMTTAIPQSAAPKPTELYAVSACPMDADTGRVLYDKNCDEVRAMASTTKIMTLVIALEYGNMQDTVTVSQYAASMPDV